MRTFSLVATLLSALQLPFTALADSHAPNHARHHQDIARRASGDVQLHKRFEGCRFTFYAVGLGACGKTNQPGDFIVALNSQQYGGGSPGPQCFKQITITANGKTASATIMDECPGCPFGGLDMSTGLFSFFAPESVGVLTGSWSFSGGGGDGGGNNNNSPPPKAAAAPKDTTTSKPPPTTTHTSSQKKASSTTTSSSHKKASSTSSATTTSLNLNKGPASGLAVPTGTIAPSDPQSINGLNLAVIKMGAVVVLGAVSQ